jgi:hypothetical protein
MSSACQHEVVFKLELKIKFQVQTYHVVHLFVIWGYTQSLDFLFFIPLHHTTFGIVLFIFIICSLSTVPFFVCFQAPKS